ncbi:MAG: RHS repeat protein, partial [bacterium]|nr:RHS repeat protein [bacterium]
VYDLLGKVLHQTDPLGRTTTMAYDLMGRLVNTTYPDATTETRGYDAEGRLLTQTDRAGRVTTFTYDAAGRLKTSTYPDGASTSSTYDDAGQLVASTDARGNTTTYAYDDAGRLTAVIDPYGKGPTFTYDDHGNQESVTDARGFTTGFSYDDLNRLTVTTHPDTTTTVVAYDDLGRRIAETDQAGLTTEFGYDALGRLKTVTDALDQVTGYSYDEVGNRLTQTDANGHTTRFEYDASGRQTARILPDDTRETKTYNADGTLASHTDFNGATRAFEYNSNRRLIRRAYPDGSEVTFSYTPTGQRATAVDARGTTSYTYDDRDRLIEKTDPNGYKLGYGYDLQGNRTRLTATVGAQVFTTTYTYDDLNRVETVTDPQGGVTTLGYDDNGNRESQAHPNGVTTTYTYDGLNRLSHLETANSIGAVLQSYAYTLGDAGNRTRIDEHDGTSRHYQYDDLYRLTLDRVTDPAGDQVYQRGFTYDPVGNRLTQTIAEGDVPTTRTSTYDSRDRLLSESPISYTWDSAGNLATKTGALATNYGWDAENRLTSASLQDGFVLENDYDAAGNRVQATLLDGGEPLVETYYLIDDSGTLAQAVAEIANNRVEALYVTSESDYLSLFNPHLSSTRYYHLDGLGSVRTLSDELGNTSDTYEYSAFGELLSHSGVAENRFMFAGQYFDSNILYYYNRARWMDPATGRFTSGDPAAGFVFDPLSLHRYTYAHVNPVNWIDPTGRTTWTLPGRLVLLAARVSVFLRIQSVAIVGALATLCVGIAVYTTMASSTGNPSPPFPPGLDRCDRSRYLVRFGAGPESKERLAKESALAESRNLPHGVSTALRKRISGTDLTHKSARLSVARSVFPGTRQTGKKKSHYTVVLPNPVTDGVAALFNLTFTVGKK